MISSTEFNRAEYYFKLLAVREILTSMPTTSAVKEVISVIGGELNAASEFLHKHMESDSLSELWKKRAEDLEKDKYSQAEDYREASVWLRAASELEICMKEIE